MTDSVRALAGAWAVAAGCAPPPPLQLVDTALEPTIEILYPVEGQVIEVGPGCVLTEQIIVNVENLELVPPNDTLVDGQGHWEAGPDLDRFCWEVLPFCVGASAADKDLNQYDGSGVHPGKNTLFARLRDNQFNPIGVPVEVEVNLANTSGYCVE